jgi:hypothetical protein
MSRDLARLAVIAAVALSAAPLHAQDVPPPCRVRAVNVERANYALVPHAANGSLCVQGNTKAVRLEVRQTTITAALSGLSAVYNISYRSSVTLDEARDGIYAGSLEHVVSRLLDGYDYVIKHADAGLDIIVLARKGGQPVTAPVATQASPNRERTAQVSRTR